MKRFLICAITGIMISAFALGYESEVTKKDVAMSLIQQAPSSDFTPIKLIGISLDAEVVEGGFRVIDSEQSGVIVDYEKQINNFGVIQLRDRSPPKITKI